MKGDGIPLTPATGPLLPRKDSFDGLLARGCGSGARRQVEGRAVRIDSMQYDRTPPHSLDVAQNFFRAFDVDAAPVYLMVMREFECSVDAHMRGGYRWRSKIVFWPDDYFMKGVQVGLHYLH